MRLKIFGADWCNACMKAKKLAEEEEIEVDFYDISVDESALNQLRELLGKEPKTIPQIFNEDGLIGGLEQLKQLLNVI